ncbi:hypothetical protein [Listeria aquatica]|nr:hypothetical protein [Listeria aquatica]
MKPRFVVLVKSAKKSRNLGVDRRLGSRYDMAIAFAIFFAE